MTFTNYRSGPKHTFLFCCFLAVLGSASAWGGWGTKSCYETYAQHVSAGQTVEFCDDIEPDYCEPSINPGAKRGTCQGHGFAVPCISDSTGDKWLVKKKDTSALEGLGWTCPSESEKHDANNNIIAVTNNIEVTTPTPKPTPKPTPSSEGWCKAGLFDVGQTVCCQSSCGKCGGDGCTSRPGGGDHCCAGGILRRGKVCSADTDTDCRFPRVNTVKYTYDLTDDPDDPGAKGAGNYDLDSYQAGKHVFYRGHPGQSFGFTLSCEKVNTGVPRQAALRAVYTDATPEDYNGPIVTGSGCSTYDFGPSHFKFSCCLDPSVPVPKADDSVATMTIDLAPQNKEPLKEGQNQLASKAATTHPKLRGAEAADNNEQWECDSAAPIQGYIMCSKGNEFCMGYLSCFLKCGLCVMGPK